MRARLIDGIIWVGVGVSLVGQGAVLLAAGLWADEAVPVDRIPPSVAGAVVSAAFFLVGAGAVIHGVRRLKAARQG